MATQTITCTALPNGVAANGRLKLSVHIAPRLAGVPGGDLSQFPDWLDWPAVELSFMVQFGNSPAVNATREGAAPDSKLWKALFVPPSPVAPHQFDAGGLVNKPIQSYPVRNIQKFLRQRYTQVAVGMPEDFPLATELKDQEMFGGIALPFFPDISGEEYDDDPRVPILDELHQQLASLKFVPPDPNESPAKSIVQLQEFHRPFSEAEPGPAPVPIPDVDVHKLFSALGRYPVLMRTLGLVHDLTVPHPGNLGDTAVQVLVSFTPAPMPGLTTEMVPPAGGAPGYRTACKVTATSFAALPKLNGDLMDGMLRLEDTSQYEVVQFDHDGGALKAQHFANNLVRATEIFRSDDTPASYSIPSLRSAGIAVARVGQAMHSHQAFLRSSGLNASLVGGGDIVFDQEDIVRGFAVDAWDSKSTQWHSLCERIGDYEFLNTKAKLNNVADEGWVGMGLTSAPDPSEPGANPNAKQPETLFRWWGWSLAAPRPGKTLGDDGMPVDPQPDPATNFKLVANFRATPGSLPRLRFGTEYRMRMRAVDLAGNRLSMAEANAMGFAHATPAEFYGRFEPVPAPEVALREPLTEGESLARMVIRSNYNTPMQAPSERHIIPPKAAYTMAELLALFDNPNTGKVENAAFALITSREAESLAGLGSPDPFNPDLVVINQANISVPYLPDLLSRAAVLKGLPGAPGPVKVSFGYDTGAKWPDPDPFRLVLLEGNGPPLPLNNQQELQVLIPKADVMPVRLSSAMFASDVDLMALLGWLKEEGVPAADIASFRQHLEAGTHWMVEPFLNMVLVHAVRQPLIRPKYSPQFGNTRELGETFTLLHDRFFEVSRKSTVRLDILAHWNETIDILSEPGPRVISGSARPFQFPVPLAPAPAQELLLDVEGRHEFGDLKYRKVFYDAIATTRFGEYFIERVRGVVVSTGVPVLLHGPEVDEDGDPIGAVVEFSDAVVASDGTKTFVRGTDYTVDYATGQLMPGASLNGMTVDIAFIATPITRDTAVSTPLDIPNATRPAAPGVGYVIPTFEWETTGAPGDPLQTSARRGGGLRVYLERPWFSSGDGELLGVVLSKSANPPDGQKPYVTRWGLDPVFESAATGPLPLTMPDIQAAFPLAVEVGTDRTLDELGGFYNVAGHEVAFDAGRRLWYCDLEVNPEGLAPDSYLPFVRLALARYHPISVPDAHLSRVVLADFIQLAPDRFANVMRIDSTHLRIVVSGPRYTDLNSFGQTSQMEASLEQLRPGLSPATAGELAWELVPASTVPFTAQPAQWEAALTLPGSGGPFRLVIKEFEVFVPGPPPPFGAGQRRLVYADTILV